MDAAAEASRPARAVETLGAEARGRFIKRTYGHLFGAILTFTAIETALFTTGLALPIARAMFSTSWLVILGGFMVVGWLASNAAHRARSQGAQYGALGAYVLAQAIIFVPLLVIAEINAPGAVSIAALVTLVGFAALTGIAFTTRADFSFLRGILMWGGVAALLLIAGSVLFGFQLGIIFSVAMVAFAGAAILYSTSKILRTYPEDRYVGAALELFASVALLFWYVLRIFMSRE